MADPFCLEPRECARYGCLGPCLMDWDHLLYAVLMLAAGLTLLALALGLP